MLNSIQIANVLLTIANEANMRSKMDWKKCTKIKYTKLFRKIGVRFINVILIMVICGRILLKSSPDK